MLEGKRLVKRKELWAWAGVASLAKKNYNTFPFGCVKLRGLPAKGAREGPRPEGQ